MAALVFDRNIGAIETVSPWALPPGYTASAVNVVLSPHALAMPRAGTVAITGSGSAPTGPIEALFTRRDGGDETIWAANLGGLATPPSLFVRTGTTWANPSLSDTDVETEAFTFAAYNGKVFLAYAGTANRLHVYDLAAASPAIRRVGLLPPGKPTMANTGSGSYAATLRRYKVQMLIHQDGSDASSPVHAASELSVADSFTPSGSGTHVRITMPTAVDSATHWRIYGSADGVTYYQITDDLAVGTTTYDDNVAPANYYAFNGVTAPEVGLYIPPPSVKYLATNGERLFMAGAYETTAASTETAPSDRRVWFTRPLGATGEGDDEAITQTAAATYWLDIDNEDGSPITALASTLDGSVYVGTATSLWRLVDTGVIDEPVRAERVVAGVGPTGPSALTATDSVDGSMIYFGAASGPYRYSPATGVQFLGADWVMPEGDALNQPAIRWCAFDPESRCVFWSVEASYLDESANTLRVFNPAYVQNVGGVWRGGWARYVYGYPSDAEVSCATVYKTRLVFGGATAASGDLLFTHDESADDDDGNAYTCSTTTAEIVDGDGTRAMRTRDPYIWKRRDQSVSLTLTKNRGGTNQTVTDTAPNETISGGETSWHRQKVEGLTTDTAYSLSVAMSFTPVITATARHSDGVQRFVVPVMPQEVG